MRIVEVRNFPEWRETARTLLAEDTPPEQVSWTAYSQNSLFANEIAINPSSSDSQGNVSARSRAVSTDKFAKELQNKQERSRFKVSKDFLQTALYVSCHRDEQKWSLLYRCLWRLTHGEKHLLKLATDDDTYLLKLMFKEVSRDRHKMKAFVRFRKTSDPQDKDGDPVYVAWHQPSHLVLPVTAPFFVRRFTAMKFVILTPDESIFWDTKTLSWGEGESRDAAPDSDELEELWCTFYRNIFNPARIKIKAMKSEMPIKYWHTMPETELISSMLAEAPSRVRKMIADSQSGN